MIVVFELKGKQMFYDPEGKKNIFDIDYKKERKKGEKITFNILKYGEEFGQPYLNNYSLIGEVITEEKKNKEITILSYKDKKRYKKKKINNGNYIEVKIIF